MKVNPKSNIDGVFDSIIKKNTSKTSAEKEKGLGRDRVELSKTSSGSNLDTIKTEIIKGVESSANADRLRELKAKIDSGSYHVSGRDIANAMLKTRNNDKQG